MGPRQREQLRYQDVIEPRGDAVTRDHIGAERSNDAGHQNDGAVEKPASQPHAPRRQRF